MGASRQKKTDGWVLSTYNVCDRLGGGFFSLHRQVVEQKLKTHKDSPSRGGCRARGFEVENDKKLSKARKQNHPHTLSLAQTQAGRQTGRTNAHTGLPRRRQPYPRLGLVDKEKEEKNYVRYAKRIEGVS